MINTVQHHHARTALPAWQRAVALVYAVLFAAIMPFICWGAWAQPCHPHSRPHFVFWEPVHALTATAGSGVECTPSALTTHAEHGSAHKGAAPNPIAGQSLPDVTIVLLLLIVLIAGVLDVFRTRQEARRLTGLLFSIQPILGVPTPPPRPG